MKYKYEQLHFHLKNHLARSRIMVIYYITIPQWQRTNKPLWLPLITHPFHWNCESFRFTLFSTRHTQTHMKSHPRLAHLMRKKWWEGHQHKCSNANVFCVRRQHVYHCLKTKYKLHFALGQPSLHWSRGTWTVAHQYRMLIRVRQAICHVEEFSYSTGKKQFLVSVGIMLLVVQLGVAVAKAALQRGKRYSPFTGVCFVIIWCGLMHT